MTPNEYNRILSRVDIGQVVLRTVSAGTPRQNFSPRIAETPFVRDNTAWDSTTEGLVVRHSYSAVVFEGSSEDVIARVEAQYEVAVRCASVEESDSFDPSSFAELFCRVQLPVMTRPYFRELMASVLGRMLIMAPPIAARFTPPAADVVEADGEDELIRTSASGTE